MFRFRLKTGASSDILKGHKRRISQYVPSLRLACSLAVTTLSVLHYFLRFLAGLQGAEKCGTYFVAHCDVFFTCNTLVFK